ncbi:MAG: amidohydrolase family protein [Planctomycetota bacterium]|jgi:hypothetical protein
MIKLTGLAAELLKEIEKIPVVDCHEHLPTEAERVSRKIDFSELFRHYTRADLEVAGLALNDAEWEKHELYDASKPVMSRWELFKPYFQAIRHGSYAYPAMCYIRDVLGFEDLTDDTVEAVSAKLQEGNVPGVYKRVMRELSGIEAAIQCKEGVIEGDQDFFVYLCRDRVCTNYDLADSSMAGRIADLEREMDRSIHTLADMADALGAYVAEQKRRGAVGLKIGAAYHRKIEFDDVPAADAERVFVRARAGVTPGLDPAERKLLEDYLVRREVEACIDQGINVVIHTGYQAGLRNDIRNARATHLWSLLRSYPGARFDLFHGSFPYTGDFTILGKYFPNVTLNMCWMHIMSPAGSRRALDEWLDAVPISKIFAFGGDYMVVEKVYGHLQLARADVAEVLAGKVTRGRMTESQALDAAGLLFCENPKRWYRLQ